MPTERKRVITFSSQNQIGLIQEDGTHERYLDFPITGQARWALGPLFRDGRRIIVTSYEDVTISKLVQGEVKTRTWIYDLQSSAIEVILQKGRKGNFMYCHSILPGESRVGVNAFIAGEERIFSMDLDGGNAVEITRAGEGFCYCVELNPAGDRLAFHVTGSKHAQQFQPLWYRPGPYSINTIELEGQERILIAGAPGHLYFGPNWAPDGKWLVYLDCHNDADPAHFWADICIGRADGSEQRVVTSGQSHWFGTTYGPKDQRGGGSNIARWMPDGRHVLYTRVAPGSHPDCEYHAELPDHCECVYNPAKARGGSQVCLLDPFNGETKAVTEYAEHQWDFRAAASPDGQKIVFTRARVDQVSELWLTDADGKNQHLLSRGVNGRGAGGRGADAGRWLTLNLE